MIYFFLLLHFIGNVFMVMLFRAFICAITKNKFTEKLAFFCLIAYSILELAGVIVVVSMGEEVLLWPIWLLAVLITLITSLVLYFLRKLDISIWGVLSIIFAPLIIIPMLFFILATRKQFAAN